MVSAVQLNLLSSELSDEHLDVSESPIWIIKTISDPSIYYPQNINIKFSKIYQNYEVLLILFNTFILFIMFYYFLYFFLRYYSYALN